MKPKNIVTCYPSKDLQKALTFYTQCFNLENLKIEDDIITIELANLSLFVMSQAAYEAYTRKFNFKAGYPDGNLQSLLSCAVESSTMIEHLFITAEKFGGTVLQPMAVNEWGQEAGYIQDPDGHVWEVVHIGS